MLKLFVPQHTWTNIFFSNFDQASKEGKTAWKLRKEAIDEVDAAVKKCSSLIDTSPQHAKQLGELMRTLRDRLSDSQGNLKPLSARVIGSLLAVTDKGAQVKLGKLVYGPLINAAISDIKKPMREASLEALRCSITVPSIEGGGVNSDALEGFMNAISSELNDGAMKVRLTLRFHQIYNTPLTLFAPVHQGHWSARTT